MGSPRCGQLPVLCAGTDRYRRRRSRRIALLALAFALLGTLFIVPANQAEAATLWNSTLNAKTIVPNRVLFTDPFYVHGVGCSYSDGATGCAQAMSDNTFVLNSQTYTVQFQGLHSEYPGCWKHLPHAREP